MAERDQPRLHPIAMRAQPAHGPPNLAAPYMPLVPAAIAQGYPNRDHEADMIANLIRHIRESLSEIPHDLPEIKGLRAKLPDPYTGEDDFDILDNWLQNLLRHFKINCLTADDRDTDRILITGTCLKGKAERWFNHEVERPTRIIRNWTFESVITGIFRAFITTATAQQAVRKYAQIKYSQDEGVTAFHRKLLLWAGRLAQ
jgi:hypothetical protein